jgi:hypothetical protein
MWGRGCWRGRCALTLRLEQESWLTVAPLLWTWALCPTPLSTIWPNGQCRRPEAFFRVQPCIPLQTRARRGFSKIFRDCSPSFPDLREPTRPTRSACACNWTSRSTRARRQSTPRPPAAASGPPCYPRRSPWTWVAAPPGCQPSSTGIARAFPRMRSADASRASAAPGTPIVPSALPQSSSPER